MNASYSAGSPSSISLGPLVPRFLGCCARLRPLGPAGSIVRRALVGVWAFGVSAFLIGCGGAANFGESVTVAQEKRTRVDDPLGAGKPVRLPADHPFNVADAQRYSTGGAIADSSADPAGRAACKARAPAGGAAWAEFQLGQVMDHRGERPLEATISFNVNYRYQIRCPSGAPGAETNKFVLKAYVQDSNKRVLKRVLLADLEPSKGPQSWQGEQSSTFDVTLEPGLAYHLVVAGRVEISGLEDKESAAEIEVGSLELEVAPRVATAMK